MDPSFRDTRCPGYYSQEHNPPERRHHTQCQSAPQQQHPQHLQHYPQQVPYHPSLLSAPQQAPFVMEHGEVRGRGDFATGHSAQSTLRSIFLGPSPVLPNPSLPLPPRTDEPLNFSPGVQQLDIHQQTTPTSFPPITDGNPGQDQLRDPGDRGQQPATLHDAQTTEQGHSPASTESEKRTPSAPAVQHEHQDTESSSLSRLDSGQSTPTPAAVSLLQTQGNMMDPVVVTSAYTSTASERQSSPQSSMAQAPARHKDGLRPGDTSTSEQSATIISHPLASSRYTSTPSNQNSTLPLAQKRAVTVLQRVSIADRSALTGRTQSEKAGNELIPVLPDCLSFKYSEEEKENISGVKAKEQIEKGVMFGPYEGNLLDEESGSTNASTWELCLRGKVFLYVDGKRKNQSSALAHIRCARNTEEQNLEAVQVLGDIYFRVTKVIEPGTELTVFYSDEYSDLIGFKTKLNDLHHNEEKDNFRCDQCEEELPTAKCMMRHIKFDHEPERAQELCPIVTWRLKAKKKKVPKNDKDSGSKADTTKPTESDVRTVSAGQEDSVCRVCGKKFSSVGRLMAHAMFHEFTHQYICAICGEKQHNTFMLARHMTKHGNRKHRCTKCDKTYKTLGALYRHERDLHGISVRRNHACRFCSMSFVKRLECVEHEKKTHKELIGTDEDEKGESNEGRVLKRVRKQREDMEESDEETGEEQLDLTADHDKMNHTLSGTKCGQSRRAKKKRVSQESKDMLGKTVDYYTKPRPYKCRYCPKRYVDSSTATDHEKEVHEGKGTFMCEHCPRVFVNEARFLEHSKSHEQNRMYRCGLCPRTFASENALSNHQGEHTGLKPFKCDLCGKGFRIKKAVNQHKRRMHQTRQMRFFCTYCNKGFPDRGGLTAHERRHRGIRPFVCLVCGKGFTVKYTLQVHMRAMHEDKKQFSCNICGKSFSLNQTFTTHMFRHKVLGENVSRRTNKQQPQQ